MRIGFLVFINIVPMFYVLSNFFFAWYKEYINWRIPFSNFSVVLPAFTYGRAILNLWSIGLVVNNFITVPKVDFIGNNPLLKKLIVNSRPS